MIARLCAAAAAASLTILAGSTASWAGEKPKPDTSHREVCHPKAGGWVVINPAQASSHIDESTGAPKHEHSGRVDVYAVNGACPTIPTATPTGGTPSTSPTATTTPSSSATSQTSTTTTVRSPSTTSSTHGSHSPTSTAPARPSGTVSTPSASEQTQPRASRSIESAPLSLATTTSHPTSAPSSTAELALTGSDLNAGVAVALFLLATGGLAYLFRRNLPRGGRRH